MQPHYLGIQSILTGLNHFHDALHKLRIDPFGRGESWWHVKMVSEHLRPKEDHRILVETSASWHHVASWYCKTFQCDSGRRVTYTGTCSAAAHCCRHFALHNLLWAHIKPLRILCSISSDNVTQMTLRMPKSYYALSLRARRNVIWFVD